MAGMGLGLRLAVKGDKDEAEGIKRGKEGPRETGPQQGTLAGCLHLPQDGVFTVETGGDQRQRGERRAPTRKQA